MGFLWLLLHSAKLDHQRILGVRENLLQLLASANFKLAVISDYNVKNKVKRMPEHALEYEPVGQRSCSPHQKMEAQQNVEIGTIIARITISSTTAWGKAGRDGAQFSGS